jgi:hypothetical protein
MASLIKLFSPSNQTEQNEAAAKAFIERICNELDKKGVGETDLRNVIIESLKTYLAPTNNENKVAGTTINNSVFHIVDRLMTNLVSDDYAEKQIILNMLTTNQLEFTEIFKEAMSGPYADDDKPKPESLKSADLTKLAHQILNNVMFLLKPRGIRAKSNLELRKEQDANEKAKKMFGQAGGNAEEKAIISFLTNRFDKNTTTEVANKQILSAITRSIQKHLLMADAREMLLGIIQTSVNEMFKTIAGTMSHINISKQIMYLAILNRPKIKRIVFEAICKMIDQKNTDLYAQELEDQKNNVNAGPSESVEKTFETPDALKVIENIKNVIQEETVYTLNVTQSAPVPPAPATVQPVPEVQKVGGKHTIRRRRIQKKTKKTRTLR